MSMNKRKGIAVLAATCALIIAAVISLHAAPVFADTYKATVKCYFVKQDGTIVGAPPEGSRAQYEVTWDSSQGETTTVYLQQFKGYTLESETVENVANGDTISIEYKQLDPLEPPGNVKVKVVDMQPGTMKLEGGSSTLSGDIASLEITFNKASKSQGVNSYWVAALKKTGPGSNQWEKMGTGTMPFIKTEPKAQFEEGETGPNGEVVTETETTITVQKKVCKSDTSTGMEYLDKLSYKTGDEITIRVMAERGKYETYENSKEVEVKIPFSNSSKGKTFTEKGIEGAGEMYSATIQCMTEKEDGTIAATNPPGIQSKTVISWPKSEGETKVVTPTPAEGYVVTPDSATVRNGDVVFFTYEKIKKVAPTVNLSKSTFTYDGKEKKPTVTVKDGKTRLTQKDYTVTYAKGRKNVGKYGVKVNLKGKYIGSNTVYFTITPPPTNITSLKAGKKSATVKWRKQTKQTSGYQIQASRKKNFKKIAVKRTVKGANTAKATLNKLTAKKKYYVRIRTFKTVKGKTYCSAWKVYKKTVEPKK